jgi:ribose 5-phosphate isomerase B
MKKFLETIEGIEILDLGTHGRETVDYPDFAHAVAEAVCSGRVDLGIMVDGAGIGSSMAANKVPGTRAAMCYDVATARNAREHNFANVLTLGGRMIDPARMREIVTAFLETPTGGERHAARVRKIMEIERKYCKI